MVIEYRNTTQVTLVVETISRNSVTFRVAILMKDGLFIIASLDLTQNMRNNKLDHDELVTHVVTNTTMESF